MAEKTPDSCTCPSQDVSKGFLGKGVCFYLFTMNSLGFYCTVVMNRCKMMAITVNQCEVLCKVEHVHEVWKEK